jgi:hypothetical protein
MNEAEKIQFLKKLDAERWSVADEGDVAREYSPDRSECRIVAVRAKPGKIASLIAAEKALANKNDYDLEWKVYQHDGHENLVNSLLAAGFKAEERESVLVYPITNLNIESVNDLTLPDGSKIVTVVDENGLEAVAQISREIGRRNVDKEKQTLSEIFKTTPNELSVCILSVNGEPVSCLRAYYPTNSIFAELVGGRTKTTHRKKGFFSALVKHFLKEAAARGCTAELVDALPISEPILRGLGFEFLTHTQPFTYTRAVNQNEQGY